MKTVLLALLLFCPAAAPCAEDLQTVTVRPGDTLWSLSSTYLKDPTKWNQILKYNRLPSSDPSIALPGMALKIPVTLIKEQYRAAKLVYYLNEVLYRRSGSEDWADVKAKMDLFRSDTLRTKSESRADVQFYTGETLSLLANSIAVLRPPGMKNTDVELKSGAVRGLRSRVVTASARITPKTKDTEFGARIKDDLTTLVQVYKGRADVEAQGKTVEVKEGFAAEVKLDMPPSQPVELPPMMEFDANSQTRLAGGTATKLSVDGGVVSLNMKSGTKLGGATASGVDKTLAKNVQIGDVNDKRLATNESLNMISVANPVQGYHLQIARDQAFTNLALNKTFDAFEKIDVGELVPPGNYWIRVALIDLLGFEGKYNTPRQVKIGR